jgi:biopolymer transport protein ExbB
VLQERLLDFALLGVEWVLWLLIILSIACLGVAIERVIAGRLSRAPADVFEPLLAAFLKSGQAAPFSVALEQVGGVRARVIGVGLSAHREGGIDAAREAIAGALSLERVEMSRGLIVLGTVGANAPFIGLFGTVLGIIQAFHDLSINTDETANAVMSGISEALVATAVGLMVAIPAVVLYNWFQRRNKTHIQQVESTAHMVLARLHRAPEE